MKKKLEDGQKEGRQHQGSMQGPLASKLLVQLGWALFSHGAVPLQAAVLSGPFSNLGIFWG